MTIRSILCPIEFDEPSYKALATASSMAKSIGAVLHVVHVLPLSYTRAVAERSDLLRRAVERHVAREVRTVQVVCEGDPVNEIANAARVLRSDLIVMALRERAAESEKMPLHVARRVECPVYGLAIGAHADDEAVPFEFFLPQRICLN